MPNGGEAADVEAVLAAAGKLASPGDALYGIAKAAGETFDLLDYQNQQRAEAALEGHLEVVFGLWDREMKALVRH